MQLFIAFTIATVGRDNIFLLRKEPEAADRVLVGAGARLSVAAGLSYFDEMAFHEHFPEIYRMGFRYQYEMVGKKDDE